MEPLHLRNRNSLLLPDPPSDPQLELLPVTTGEEQGHVPLDDEPVVAVPDFPVAVSDATRDALPCHLAATASDLEAVAVVLGFNVVSHEPEEGDVHRCHAQLECLEVQTKALAKTAENLEDDSTVSYRILVSTQNTQWLQKILLFLPKRKVTGLVMAVFTFRDWYHDGQSL
jgi:hypothetical protein